MGLKRIMSRYVSWEDYILIPIFEYAMDACARYRYFKKNVKLEAT